MNKWDERYDIDQYFYGIEPNDFLRANASIFKKGDRVLCLAEGEGRNAVHLASLGLDVTAVDASAVGLMKLENLARSRGVAVKTVVSDLREFRIKPAEWDGIVSIWAHLPKELRATVHHRCIQGLRAGGHFLLEAYTPKQLEFATGGPPTADLMMDLGSLRRELEGLEFLHATELERVVREGMGHNGRSAVVQIIGRRTKESW